MNIGWIIIHRCLLDKPIWKGSTPEQKTILITLLLMMDFKPNEWEWKGEKFHTKPGEKVTSLNSIMERAGKGISLQNVRSALKRFGKLQFLTDNPTRLGRLISIVNWDSYQEIIKETNKGSNKEVTKTQQRGNKDLTPKEQSNKVTKKQDNKNKRAFSKPSLLEIGEYCIERKNTINPSTFFDFYESKNWMIGKNKMKNWKACVRTWENKQQTNKRKTAKGDFGNAGYYGKSSTEDKNNPVF